MDKQNKVDSQQKVKATKEKNYSTVTFKELGIDKVSRSSCDISFSIWVRSLMQNWRQGTLACQGRSDVSRTNKKPFKQKGTGRARAGSARSPLWRGGGVVFGPQARSKSLRVAKRTKKRVLGDVLLEFLGNKKISCLNWNVKTDKPKTSEAFQALKSAGINSDRLILFVQPGDFLTQASFSNMPNVNIMFFDQANAFDLTNGKRWVFLEKDFDVFKDMVTKWL